MSADNVIVSSLFIRRYGLLVFGAINIIIGPFLIYVILTKSKVLGTYKYYLLYQTIFVQIFELLMIHLNPVLLNPYMSGFMGGLIGPYINYAGSIAICCSVFCLLTNMIVAVCLSVTNRFFFMFLPDFRKYLENKYTMCFIAVCHLMSYAIVFILFLSTATNAETVRQIAHNESNGEIATYFNESSFVYVTKNSNLPRYCCLIFFVVVGLLSILLLGSILFAVIHIFIKKKTNVVVYKTATSLLIVALIQALLCVFLLIFPIMWILGTWGFNMRFNVNITNALISMLSMYGTIDMLSMLYFVVPYRKYCMSLIGLSPQSQIKKGFFVRSRINFVT